MGLPNDYEQPMWAGTPVLKTYQPEMERPEGDKCPKCGSKSALLTKTLLSYCQRCGNRWL